MHKMDPAHESVLQQIGEAVVKIILALVIVGCFAMALYSSSRNAIGEAVGLWAFLLLLFGYVWVGEIKKEIRKAASYIGPQQSTAGEIAANLGTMRHETNMALRDIADNTRATAEQVHALRKQVAGQK